MGFESKGSYQGAEHDAKTTEQRILEMQEGANGQILADMANGGQFSEMIVGDGLGRISDQAGVADAREMLRQQTQGLSGEQQRMMREAGREQIGNQTQTSQREAASRLASVGVKGGAAGAQFARIAASGQQASRQLERGISLQQINAQQQGVRDFAQVESEIAKFDLGQAAKEKNLDIQARLSFAELASAERANIRATEASKLAHRSQRKKSK